MNTNTLYGLIQQLNLQTYEQEYFIYGTMDKPKYYKQINQIDLSFHLEQTIPYATYSKVKLNLKELLKSNVSLSISAKRNELDINDCIMYIRSALDSDQILDAQTVLIKINQQKLIFICINNQQFTVYQANQDKIESSLIKYGLSYTITVELKEYSSIEIEDKVIKPSPPKISKESSKKGNQDEKKYDLISEVYEGQREARLRAKIFLVEITPTKNNTVDRLVVYIHDESGAISFTQYLDSDEKIKRSESLLEGVCIEIIAEVKSDMRNELFLVMKSFNLIEDWLIPEDTAIEKRVELHLHTNMSEMDGVSTIEEYIQLAYDWNHSALAITDHFSVQSFPKAQNKMNQLLKENPDKHLKIIYGCEMNMVDTPIQVVQNSSEAKLEECEYVIFDIETTGLSSQYDWIIEFAAIKIRNGMRVDSMQMFVKPPVPLSSFTTQMTDIKQSDVDDAKTEQEHLLTWLEFIKGTVLVAHNANFDYGFMNAICTRYGYPLLNNAVIDTLNLAKILMDERKSYRLGALAKQFKIDYHDNVAHRADYDTDVLNQIFQRLLSIAKDQNCITLNDLQNHSECLNFKKAKEFHVNLLAKNADGLKNLFELITLSHTERLLFNAEEESINEPSLLRTDISDKRKDLLVGSSCYNSEIFEIAMNRSQIELEQKMLFYDFIEVQAPSNYSPLLENHNLPSNDRLETIIKNIIMTAERLNILVVASGDVHYALKHEKIFRDIYINAKGIGKSRHPLYLYQDERRLNNVTPDQHFRTSNEMLDCFSFLEEDLAYRIVIKNTNLIANKIEIIYPIRDSLYTPHIDQADERLKEIVQNNALEMYGNPLPEIVSNRLNKELTAITTHGFSVIYYIAHLLVKKSLDDGYMVGSRGSVGSSLVATMAKITEVNPLPPHYVCPACHFSEFYDDGSVDSGYDLATKNCPKCKTQLIQDGQDIPFETFLGFEGDKVPDIDLNFSSEYQDKAHAYTKVLFGDKHVFRAGTITTVADKTAFGYVKGYIEELKIDKPFTSAYRTFLAHGAGGVKRTSGQHPGGIIVIPQDMDVHDFTPVQYPANKINADWLTTHFEFADLHDNVLKLDILGHVDPSAMKMLENLTKVDIQSIPINDKKTISIFSSTKYLNCDQSYNEKTGAVGLPEFGTNFVRQILEATQPKDFSDLVRISGLSHGKEVWSNNARDLIKDGLKLNEVIGCRDDIMVYLIHKGLSSKQAFDIMESVRKGRGLKEEWKKLMLDNHVPEWYIESCQRIKYMFPKAHAVAYVLMAVRVAWFKVYYPNYYYLVFFTLRCSAFEYETMIKPLASIISRLKNIQSRLNDMSAKKDVSTKEKDLILTLEVLVEMLSRGYHLNPLDLKLSQASQFILHPTDPKILIPPFIIIDGLGENVAKSIVEAREKQAFMSKEDLMKRTLLNNSLLNLFTELEILKSLEESNQMVLF